MSVYIQFALSVVRMRPDESRFKKNTVRHNMPARSHNTFDIGSSPAPAETFRKAGSTC